MSDRSFIVFKEKEETTVSVKDTEWKAFTSFRNSDAELNLVNLYAKVDHGEDHDVKGYQIV